MRDCRIAGTANRSVVGIMNEFARLTDIYRDDHPRPGLLDLSARLATTPCSPLYRTNVSPDRELAALLRSLAHLTRGHSRLPNRGQRRHRAGKSHPRRDPPGSGSPVLVSVKRTLTIPCPRHRKSALSDWEMPGPARSTWTSSQRRSRLAGKVVLTNCSRSPGIVVNNSRYRQRRRRRDGRPVRARRMPAAARTVPRPARRR